MRGFLQGLVTNDVDVLAPDRPLWAGLLTAQGKALFDFILWADGDDVLIDCEREAAGDLARRLTLYRLRRPIAIAREEACASTGRRRARRASPTRACRRSAAAGSRPSRGEAAEGWLEHRLPLGVTEGMAELGSDKTFWLECNAAELNGVSFAKGCYVGQENTARMNWRNKVNRRLVVVPADAPGRGPASIIPSSASPWSIAAIDDLGDAIVPTGWLRRPAARSP